MSIPLNPNEKLLKQGDANLLRGHAHVGGALSLTDQRVFFQAHALNFNRGDTEIPLDEIKEVRACRTKFMNLIPLTDNSIAIATTDGQQYSFVVDGRADWLQALRQYSKESHAITSHQ